MDDGYFTPKTSYSHLNYHYKKIKKTRPWDNKNKGLGQIKKQRQNHYHKTTTPPEYNKNKVIKLDYETEREHSTNKKMFLRQQHRISNTNIELYKQNDVSYNFACKHLSSFLPQLGVLNPKNSTFLFYSSLVFVYWKFSRKQKHLF